MNYTSRYGLEFNPFIKNSKELLVVIRTMKKLRLDLTIYYRLRDLV